MKYGLVGLNLVAATFCVVSAAMNFSAGNVALGSFMSSLFVMNVGIAIINVNRH